MVLSQGPASAYGQVLCKPPELALQRTLASPEPAFEGPMGATPII